MRSFLLLLAWLLAVSAPDMSVGDAAKYLGVTRRTVYTMVADGRLRAYRLGYRIIRFRRDEIDAALTPVDAVTEPVADIPPKTQRGPVRRRRDEIDAAMTPVGGADRDEPEFATAPR